MAIQVTRIRVDGGDTDYPHTAISSLSWIEDGTNERGSYSRVEMYLWLINGGHAYVYDDRGNKVYLIAQQTEQGIRYVRTTTETNGPDELFALPRFSSSLI